jgi:hypothetical protein
VPWTKNSLKMTPTKNHNMQASVWFKEPERKGRSMSQHYLLPQVEGGIGPLRGFERALGSVRYLPGKNARLDKYGNVSVGQIKQILAVLGKAEYAAGSSSNMTTRSKGRNKKLRDYVWLPRGRGKLPPGIYERFTIGNGVLVDKKARRVLVKIGKGNAIWEQGKGGVVRARGLRAVLVAARGKTVRPRLPFYEIVKKVVDARLVPTFIIELSRRIRLRR